MTAPTPSPEEFVRCLVAGFSDDELALNASLVSQRDAALLAPLRAENALLRAEATAHMGVARAAEADVTRLREALEQAHRYATGQSFRILTDALAEGQT